MTFFKCFIDQKTPNQKNIADLSIVRILTILVLVAITQLDVLAQFHVGPKIAFTYYKSRFNFPEDEELFEQKFKPGYQIGGAFDLPLKNIFNFAGEFYFSQKGKKTIIKSSGLTNDATYYFLEAPVLLRLGFVGGNAEAGQFHWHIDFGPTISYWLGGHGTLQGDGPQTKYDIKFGDPGLDASTSTMYISNANRWQWGLNLGVGLEYPVVKNQFVFIDLRTMFGSTNLAQHDGAAHLPILGFNDSLDVRYLEFILSVVYAFEIDYKQTRKGKSTIDKRKQK